MSMGHAKTRRVTFAVLSALAAITAAGCVSTVDGTPVAASTDGVADHAATAPAYTGPALSQATPASTSWLEPGTQVRIGDGETSATCQISWFLHGDGGDTTYAVIPGHCERVPGSKVYATYGALTPQIGVVTDNFYASGTDAALVALDETLIPIRPTADITAVSFTDLALLGRWATALPEAGTVACWTLNEDWGFDCGAVADTGDFAVTPYDGKAVAWDGSMAGTPVMVPEGRGITPVGLISGTDSGGNYVVTPITAVLAKRSGLTLALRS